MGGSSMDDDWEFAISPKASTTVVLVGRTGNGKSATGNSILGRKAFKSQRSSSGVTSTCELQETVLRDGRTVNVIDTPVNWWDTYGVLTPVIKKIAIRILGLCCMASNCERSWSTFEIIQSKRRSSLDTERLKKLVFIKYNKTLYERFEKRRAQNNSEDFDPIRVEDLNYSSEWMTGKTGAFNEFVYGEEGLTWAEVDEAIGASEIIVRPKRSSTLTIGEIGARGGRGAIRHNDYVPVRTYSRKMKQIVNEEHDFEDDGNKDEDEEGFEFTDESDAMINEDEDD